MTKNFNELTADQQIRIKNHIDKAYSYAVKAILKDGFLDNEEKKTSILDAGINLHYLQVSNIIDHKTFKGMVIEKFTIAENEGFIKDFYTE